MVSIRWYLGCLKVLSRGAGTDPMFESFEPLGQKPGWHQPEACQDGPETRAPLRCGAAQDRPWLGKPHLDPKT